MSDSSGAEGRTPARRENRDALVEKFLDVQGREMDLRSSELNRGAKQDEYSFEIAKQSIAAQQEDATAGRTHELDLIKWGTLRWVLAVAASIAVFLTLIVMGHVDLAKQIASHLGVTLLAGYGGFYMGKNRAKEEPRADLN